MSNSFDYPNNPLPWHASPHDFTGENNLGIYAVETTQRYVCGTRYIAADGSVYRYCKSASEIHTSQACSFTHTGATGWTSAGIAANIGDRRVTAPAATHAAAFEENELAGGYVFIYGAAHTDGQLRLIIGNDYSAAGAAVILYLDGPLDTAVVESTSAYEVFENPWSEVTEEPADKPKYAKAGVPAAYVSATGMYFWCRERGPSWLAAQSSCNDNGGVGLAFRDDGSMEGIETAYALTVPASDTSQYAGYRLVGSQAGNGPLVMLQG